MINYSRQTLGQVSMALMIRAAQYIRPENLDSRTVVKYINRAIKEISLMAYQHKRWEYIRRVNVATGDQIDIGLIRIIRVLFSEADSTPPYMEGRYAAPSEYYAVTRQSGILHSWNQALTRSPVYTIYGDTVTWTPGTLLAPMPACIYYEPTAMYGVMEYYGMPQNIADDTDILPVPYEFEDYILSSCLYRLYSRIATPDRDIARMLYERVTTERNIILKSFEAGKAAEKKELDKSVDSVMPMEVKR